jgi:hypothetical protein
MPFQTHNETSGFESPDPFLFAYAKGYVEQVHSGNGAFMLERYLHHQRKGAFVNRGVLFLPPKTYGFFPLALNSTSFSDLLRLS